MYTICLSQGTHLTGVEGRGAVGGTELVGACCSNCPIAYSCSIWRSHREWVGISVRMSNLLLWKAQLTRRRGISRWYHPTRRHGVSRWYHPTRRRGISSYKADPEKKKASVRDSYKADPEKKKAPVRDSYNADIESKHLLKGSDIKRFKCAYIGTVIRVAYPPTKQTKIQLRLHY